jgi:hypothetical protein
MVFKPGKAARTNGGSAAVSFDHIRKLMGESDLTLRYCGINGEKAYVSGITEHLFFPPQIARYYENQAERICLHFF